MPNIRIIAVLIFLSFSELASGQMVKRDTLVLKQPIGTFANKNVSTSKTQVIPADLYTQCFGFFCKQELKMQKAHIPVTFRLGSMEYVNRMEGKNR